MKVLAYLNLHHSPGLGPLTSQRSSAVVSFLGRYALMDFMLSNFSNSGIDRIVTLVDANPHSVLKHLGSRNTFNINTKIGLEIVAYNEKGSKAGLRYNTDVANILFNDWIIEQATPDYIIVAPSYFLAPLDFRPILEKHVKEKAEVTIVYQTVTNAKQDFIGRGIFELDAEGKAINFARNKGEVATRNVSLDIFIFNVDTFKKYLKEALEISSFYTLSDIVAHHARRGLQVHAVKYDGYLRCVDSYQHYVDYSFELLNYKVRRQLFLKDWPIYTVTHDTPPAKYEISADVNNCFIANGCLIAGKVKNSIISRNVKIEEGASVENSIIFTDSIVKSGRSIDYTIIDKNCSVSVAEELKGSANDVLYVRKGDRV